MRKEYIKRYIGISLFSFLIANLFFSPILSYVKIRKPDFLVYLLIVISISAFFIIVAYSLYLKIKIMPVKNTNYLSEIKPKEGPLKLLMEKNGILSILLYTINEGNVSATGILDKNILSIYVFNEIYEKISEIELNMLVLHEFAHIKFKHTKILFINYFFTFLFMIISASIFIQGYLVPYSGYLILFVVIYMFAMLILFVPLRIHYEIKADLFAIQISNDKESMKSLLEKAYLVAKSLNSNRTYKELRGMTKAKDLRIEKIEAYR